MEILFNSFLLVAATEMGDKTQLLAFLLVARFRKPWVILGGIFVATVLNHLFAALVGGWISQLVSPLTLRWVLASIFLAFAIWVLIPDKEEEPKAKAHLGAFLTTLIAFFLAEMGDKTQLATVALAARYQNLALVTAGTTLGMMFSDGLAIFFGKKILKKISMKFVRWFSAGLFILFAVSLLFV